MLRVLFLLRSRLLRKKKKNYTRSSYDLRERGANTNLEGNEADKNACDEENEGYEEPDDTPHFCRILASQKM